MICDGRILVVSFPDDAKMATFRGRKSESGNRMHNMPEPKLSWEYCRCQCHAAQWHVQCNANNIVNDLNEDEDDNNGGRGGIWDLGSTLYVDSGTARRGVTGCEPIDDTSNGTLNTPNT